MSKTRNKGHLDDALQFDGLSVAQFPQFTPGAAVANSAITGIWVAPCAIKIQGVTVTQRTGANFLTAVNIEMGTAADGGVAGTPDTSDVFTITGAGGVTGGYPPTLAVANNTLFGADQVITSLLADVPQTFMVPTTAAGNLYDIIWPQGALLTLRVVTAGAGGLATVSFLYKPFDIKPYLPRSTTLNLATDI
jgi:hypothetical protein